MVRLTLKWCYPKPLEMGTEGSRGTVAVRPPSFPFLGGLLFTRSGVPVKLPVVCGVVRSLSAAAPLPASAQRD